MWRNLTLIASKGYQIGDACSACRSQLYSESLKHSSGYELISTRNRGTPSRGLATPRLLSSFRDSFIQQLNGRRQLGTPSTHPITPNTTTGRNHLAACASLRGPIHTAQTGERPFKVPKYPQNVINAKRTVRPVEATAEETTTTIPAIPPRPSRQQALEADLPPIPARPSKRPQKHDSEVPGQLEPPELPQRETWTETPVLPPTEDYLIDGLEKHVPLLPAETSEDLTPSLSELVFVPHTPRRPIARESMESHASEDVPSIPARPRRRTSTDTQGDTEVPVIPQRPSRTRSMEPSEEPPLPRRPSQKSQKTNDEETPIIPARPTRKPSMESIEEPIVPQRPIRRPSIKSEKSDTEPPEQTSTPSQSRRLSVKSIPETTDEPPEPVIPARPTRTPSIKSIPEVGVGSPESVPSVPPRPPRTPSIKSIPETAAPDQVPVVPQRPARRGSVKSFKSQHSIDEIEQDPSSSDKSPESVPSIPEKKEDISDAEEDAGREGDLKIPERPKIVEERKHLDEKEGATAPAIEEVPTSPHQHSLITDVSEDEIPTEATLPNILPQPPKEEESLASHIDQQQHSLPKIPSRPTKKHPAREDHISLHHEEEHSTPAIPARPIKKSVATEGQPSELRTAAIAGLTATALTPSIPSIPPRPTRKPKSAEPAAAPQVAMDQTPRTIPTPTGLVTSTETPLATRKHDIPPASKSPSSTASDLASSAKSQPPTTTVIGTKQPGVKPPIPARPIHKVARQFEQAQLLQQGQKEKPTPPPRPVKVPGALAGGSKFAGLRAQFARDLDAKLAKPPPAVPTKAEEEVHTISPAEGSSASEGIGDLARGEDTKSGSVTSTVGDVRKGRARGPQRRPPTVKPIVPEGWGISVISTVFEQRVVSPVRERSASAESEKKESTSQTGEFVIESEQGVKTVYVEGGVVAGGHGLQHIVVPMETKNAEDMTASEVHEKEMEVKEPGMLASPVDVIGEMEMGEVGAPASNEKEEDYIAPKEEVVMERGVKHDVSEEPITEQHLEEIPATQSAE